MSLSSGINTIDALIYSSWNPGPGAAITLTYSFLLTVPANASEADAHGFAPMPGHEQQAVRSALAAWAAVANIAFIERASGANLQFGTNDQGEDSAAYAYLPDAGSRHATAVYTNNRSGLSDQLAPGEAGFTVLLHEIGHTLGLKHPGPYDAGDDEAGGPYLPAAQDSRAYTQMSYQQAAAFALHGQEGLTPMLYDVQAVQYLYGANTAWHAGDDVYAFSANSAPRTVWDGGGFNVFDFSGCEGGVLADLRPGGISATSAGFDNIGIAFGATIHKVVTGAGSDTVFAADSGSMIEAGAGRDTIHGGAGNDRIAGGEGLDTLVLHGPAARYQLVAGADGWAVEGAGRDTLSSVERIRYADSALALDIDGVAGQVYRLYQAAFDRAPDAGGLGYWIDAGDRGASLGNVAQGFIDSAEFSGTYGPLDNAAFVTRLYINILDRMPEAGGLAYHVGLLERGEATRNITLLEFSESPENQALLVGVIGHGFATPFLA